MPTSSKQARLNGPIAHIAVPWVAKSQNKLDSMHFGVRIKYKAYAQKQWRLALARWKESQGNQNVWAQLNFATSRSPASATGSSTNTTP